MNNYFTEEEYNRVREGSKTSPELRSLLSVMNHMIKETNERNNKNTYDTQERFSSTKDSIRMDDGQRKSS